MSVDLMVDGVFGGKKLLIRKCQFVKTLHKTGLDFFCQVNGTTHGDKLEVSHHDFSCRHLWNTLYVTLQAPQKYSWREEVGECPMQLTQASLARLLRTGIDRFNKVCHVQNFPFNSWYLVFRNCPFDRVFCREASFF